jgi:hypothetical protein
VNGSTSAATSTPTYHRKEDRKTAEARGRLLMNPTSIRQLHGAGTKCQPRCGRRQHQRQAGAEAKSRPYLITTGEQ